MSPKMSARSGLAGKRPSRPYLGLSQAILSIDRQKKHKQKKCSKFANFPWWANGPYSPGLGPFYSAWHYKDLSVTEQYQDTQGAHCDAIFQRETASADLAG